MFNLSLLRDVLFGDKPAFPNIASMRYEELPHGGLTMGNLIAGKQGSGKSTMTAYHRVLYDIEHPEDATISLDASSSYTDDYIAIACSYPDAIWHKLADRIIYVRVGDDKFAVPLPEFSKEYGVSFEEQTRRVAKNFTKLSDGLDDQSKVLGAGALKSILPRIFEVMTAMSFVKPYEDPLQITEAATLLDNPTILKDALVKCGDLISQDTRAFLYNRYINVKAAERELRSYTLTQIFADINTSYAKAQLGYPRPIWTPQEAIEEGKIVLVDTSKLNNQKELQAYLLTQVYSMFIEQINKRNPHDPRNNHVALVIDEVKRLLKDVPGMAEDVGEVSPLYRSRNLQLYILIQTLAQLDEKLEKEIWSLGNIVCFSLANKDDALEFSRQLITYDPRKVKQEPKTIYQNPTTESEPGQDRIGADWITEFQQRECILRRHHTVSKKDPYIRYVKRTREVPPLPDRKRLEEIKDALLTKNSVRITDALDAVNRRIERLYPIPKRPTTSTTS